MNNQEENDDVTKIIIIGEQAVGKSSLIMRFCDGDFDLNMIGTAGVDFRKKTIQLDGNDAKLILFDTAGQQRFRTITKHFYQGCKGVLLVYDTSESNSFGNLKEWLKTIQDSADQGVEILLVGNKIDLPRQVSTDEGKAFSNEVKIPLVEASAKTGVGVAKAFETLIRNILKKQNDLLLKEQNEKEVKEKPLNIEKEDPNKKKKATGCCSG